MRDDERKPERRFTRRGFCQAAGLSACGLAAGGSAVISADFLRPRVLFEPATNFAVAPPETIGLGTVLDAIEHRAFVIRLPDGFRAYSSVCTHLGCVTRFQPDRKLIACPCHGSRFTLEGGEVLTGPATRPLRWLQMALSDKGEITVDTAVEVPVGTVYKF